MFILGLNTNRLCLIRVPQLRRKEPDNQKHPVLKEINARCHVPKSLAWLAPNTYAYILYF
jgi:hypothetical protein